MSFTKHSFLILILCFVCLLIAGTASAQTIIRVTPAGAGDNSGTSWANAVPGNQLQAKINSAITGTQIWVAKGTYVPTINPVPCVFPCLPALQNPRDKTFLLKNGITLYGGFTGTEAILAERNKITNNPTILSGDINNTPLITTDDAYHVLASVSNNNSAVLDVFIIEKGNANGGDNITIGGLAIGQNSGGGVYLRSSSSLLINNIFRDNIALLNGGGIYSASSSSVISNTVFSKNKSTTGGAMYNSVSAPLIINSTFNNNSTPIAGNGGAIFNNGSIPNITNCIIYGNVNNINASNNMGGTFAMVSYSLVEGGNYTNNGNNLPDNTNPIFINALAGDFRLKAGSPAIDKGDEALITAGTPDISGKARISGITVDMGAYESNYPTGANGIVYVKKDATGNSTGDSWTNAVPEFADALDAARNNPAINQVWVAKGEYKPLYNPVTYNVNDAVNPRDLTFLLPDNLAIYGGFAGNESSISERDIASNATILSGDIGQENVSADNAYHVLITVGNSSSTTLDGFIVEKGNADGVANGVINGFGVGRAVGAAMFNAYSSVEIGSVIFRLNTSAFGGGAIYNLLSSSNMKNTMFITNSGGNQGGAINNSSSSSIINNSTFSANTANAAGGVIFNQNSSHSIINNSILYNNTGGEIVNNDAASTTIVSNSVIQGGYANGNSIINADPIFADPVAGNYKIKTGSPAINAGLNASIPAGVTTDLAGKPRIQNTLVDMGAYESTLPTADVNGIVYVKPNGAGNLSGNSWSNAAAELADALKAAESDKTIKQIWVAKGEYKPLYNPVTYTANQAADPRDVTFLLPKDIAVYGGFAGTESSIASRDIAANLTILSGNINNLAVNTDNAYHVLVAVGNNSSTVLDGFIVEKGNADGSNTSIISTASISRGNGGAMFNLSSLPVIDHTIFRLNSSVYAGGGLYNDEISSPTIINSTFTENKTEGDGGAIYNTEQSSPTIINTRFNANEASGSGGALYNQTSTSNIINSVFMGNVSSLVGSGIYANDQSNLNIINSTFYNNELSTSNGTSANITNSIFYSSSITNSASNIVSNSIVDGGYANGTNIIDADPQFVNAATGDFHIKLGSPAINAGLNASIPVNIDTDLAGNPRIQKGTIDLGAYESNYFPLPTGNATNPIIYVKQGGAGNYSGDSWENAAAEVADALESAHKPGSNVAQIWVAKGEYKPMYNPVLNSTDTRDVTFLLRDGLALHGGFKGDEAALPERNLSDNPTVLSGNIGDSNLDTDNAYHVLVSVGGNSSTILNGFIIEKGNANGSENPTIEGMQAMQNSGAGMHIISSSPLLINNIFRSNSAQIFGGGLYNNMALNVAIINTVFTKNTSTLGGGIYNNASAPVIINSTFNGNKTPAMGNGGAMFNTPDSSPSIANSIIYGNTTNDPSVLNNVAGTPPTASYSLIQGGNYDNIQNNLPDNTDPMLVDAIAGDFRLKQGSLAINTGNNANIPTILTTIDITGKPRILNNTVDMGAYETLSLPAGANGKMYVKKGITTGNFNGDSWANATPELADALESTKNLNTNGNATDNITEIRVAKGEYKPAYNPVQYASGSTPDGRDITLLLPTGVALYGGFVGEAETETIAARNMSANPTTLSGNIGNADDSDNVYHVLVTVGTNSATILDGFIVEKGNADGNTDAIISGQNINRGYAGGMYNNTSSPIINNSIFNENKATFRAGAMFNNNSSPKITNTIFNANRGDLGGAIYNSGNSPQIITTLFSKNTADQGGAIYNADSSSPLIVNSTFNSNIANEAGAIYNNSSSPVITNSILYGDSGDEEIINSNNSTATVSYSLIYGGYAGGTNIDAYPVFEDPVNGDFRLTSCSPALNIGGVVPAGVVIPVTDLAGNARTFGAAIDLGAYELQSAQTPLAILPATLPAGEVLKVYSADLSVNGCVAVAVPVFTVSAGSTLPNGITLTPDGHLGGTPTSGGTFSITAEQNSRTVTKEYTLLVKQAPVITFVQIPVKTYGDADFTLVSTSTGGGTPTYSSDNAAVAEINGTTVKIKGAGQAKITVRYDENANFTVKLQEQTFTVNKALLTITADNKSKVTGTPNPPLTASYSAFVNGENSGVLIGQLNLNTTANQNSLPGDYPITINGASAVNYAITSVNGVLTVLNQNTPPSDIGLASQIVFENQPVNTSAGTLSSVSNDPNAIFTYSLVTGAGSTDNASFSISGNQLLTAQSLNFENKSQYSIRIRSAAQFGSLEKSFVITISDVNEQPTLNAIADQALCSTAGIQTINLSGITPGPESSQSSLLSVSSDNPALFKTLSVGAVLNGTANLSYELETGAIGMANITVNIKDNGGTANGGVNELNRTFKLSINALPAAAIMSNKGNSISKGETVTLVASGGDSYSWADGNGIIGSQNTATLTARPNQTTTYQVLVSNATGCSSVQSITIEVREDYQAVKASNLLTPNGDGINDTWVVENIDQYQNGVVHIYDDAYREVFSQKGYVNTWAGTLQDGQPLTEGTYYYVIDFGKGLGQFKGFITLLRE